MNSKVLERIQIGRDIFGRAYEYLPMARVSGRNYLSKNGFVFCENKDYMKQGERYFHYNRLQGRWIGETPVYTADNRAVIA